MPKPANLNATVDLVRRSGLINEDRFRSFLATVKDQQRLSDLTPDSLLAKLVEAGLLTRFQASQLLHGRHVGFRLGTYRILDRLGRGGMGQVFLAEHTTLGRRVAIKVLRAQADAAPKARERFFREAKAAAQLAHPNIVSVHDLNMDVEPPYLVMEYVDGTNLQVAVAHHGTFQQAEAAYCGYQIALGLQHAHEHGLVHRDIKPANILLDKLGHTRILDLGIVRIKGESIPSDDNNEMILGTLEYLAPEQAENSDAVDTRADIYSLGATLYFLLTGRPPFNDDSQRLKLMKLLTTEPEPIRSFRPDLDEGFAQLVHRLLAKRPDNRFATPGDAAIELAAWKQGLLPNFHQRFFTVQSCPSIDIQTPTPISNVGPTAATPFTLAARTPLTEHTSSKDLDDDGRISDPTNPNLELAECEATIRTQLDEAIRESVIRGSASQLYPQRAPRPWTLFGAIGGGLIVIVLGLYLLWGLLRPVNLSEKQSSSSSATQPLVPIQPQRPPAGVRWVANTAGPNTYPSIAAAIRDAKPNDRIELREPIWREHVLLDDTTCPNGPITISGHSRNTIWLREPTQPAASPLLTNRSRQLIRLMNLTLDGEQACQELVKFEGSDGGVLDSVTFRNMSQIGVLVVNASPTRSPFKIERCRFLAPESPHHPIVAIRLSSTALREPLYQPTIAHNRFEGPLHAALAVEAPIEGLNFSQNRLLRTIHGIVSHLSATAFSAKIDRNMFVHVGTALHFVAMPKVTQQAIQFTGNVFSDVGTIGRMMTLKGQPANPPPAIWATAYQWDHGLAPAEITGHARFVGQFTLPLDQPITAATINYLAGEYSQVWVNGVAVTDKQFHAQLVNHVAIEKVLKPGLNTIAIAAWSTFSQAACMAQVEVGNKTVFSTQQPWLATLAPWGEPDLTWTTHANLSPHLWKPAVPLLDSRGNPVKPSVFWLNTLVSQNASGWISETGHNVFLGVRPLCEFPLRVSPWQHAPTTLNLSMIPSDDRRFLRIDRTILPTEYVNQLGVQNEN